MKFTYKKFRKKSDNLSLEISEKTLISKDFDEILNKEYNSLKNINKDLKEYYEIKKQKELASIKERYIKLFEKPIRLAGTSFTEEDKLLSIAEFETQHPYILDESLYITKQDSRLTKKIQRVQIKHEVRDDGDTIADLAKWNSLLTSTIFAIYDTLSATNKDKIPANQKALIEGMKQMFQNTETVADYNLATAGESFITEMLIKEAKIKKIVKG